MKMFDFRVLNCLSHSGTKKRRPTASVTSGPSYYVRYSDLRKLHRAAHRGNVPEVQQLLSLRPDRLNDRDKMKRTALHLACANGHLGVVTLLADRKCHMNLQDKEGRTALIKTIQCGRDECATLLLECGADPDIEDTNGNRALHYAILYENVAMATKLLLHKADIEARNKDGLTPFLLAVSKNKQQMVEFLIERNANIHALDKMRRTALMLAVNDESSNIVRLLLQQGVDVFAQDALGQTAEGTASFRGTKKNWKLISDYQQERRCKESSEYSNLDTDQQISPKQVPVLRKTNATAVKATKQNQQREKVYGTVSKKPVAECSKSVSTSSVSSITDIDDSWSTSEDKDFKVDTKEGPTKLAFGKEENGMDIIESAPQQQTNHASLTYVDGAHKIKMSALGLGEEEDRESPWDPESLSASHPQKHVDRFSGSSFQRGKNKLTKKVEDSPETYPHLEPATEVKDPDPKKTVVMKNVAPSISDFSAELHLGRKSEEVQANRDGTENNHPHVSESHDLLHEIAKLRLEINTVKSQHQAMEKQYCKKFANVKEKNSCLQKKIKMNKETIFQYKGQLNVLTAENTMLNSKLDNEKQKEDILKTEAESYHLRLLTAATHDYEQSQKDISSLQVALQGVRDECFRSQDKMNLHMSILKDNNETLLERLSKVESKFNSLETELHHTRDAVTERTLVLECVQRDLSQTQRQKEEIEHMYQSERGKVNTYMGRLESLEERFSQLQSENMLLRQQLDDARKRSDNNEKTVNKIQDRLQDIVKIFQSECETQSRMLEERDKQLIHELNHLKERMYQYEKDKAEREVVVRQLQELADTVKKLLMTQASLEYTSRYRMHLEAETQDLKKTSEHVTSHSQDAKEQLKNYIELNQSLELRLDQEKKKTSELGKRMTKLKKFFNITRRELNESENGDLSFSEDLKPNQIDMDIQINRFKQKIDDLTAELETASSERRHLNEKTKYLQQELFSMKGIEKKCEKLENKEKELKQELLNLMCHMTPNMVENSEVEHYKREIEERARQDVAEKLKVNVFLQGQAASQEYLDQLRENNNAAMKSQMELRMKDLESELSKVKTSLGDSTKEELELYKQLYLEEAKVRTSLENQLNNLYRSNERPAEISTPLAVKERQNTLLSTAMKRPVLEPPCVGSLHNSSLFSRNLDPRENLVISTPTPWTSNVTQRLI